MCAIKSKFRLLKKQCAELKASFSESDTKICSLVRNCDPLGPLQTGKQTVSEKMRQNLKLEDKHDTLRKNLINCVKKSKT